MQRHLLGLPSAQGASASEERRKVWAIPCPPAWWPVSIYGKDGNFEEVIRLGHKAKGHPDVKMMVKRFWVEDWTSMYQYKLMTRELAINIGSCLTPDEDGNLAGEMLLRIR